MVTAWKVACPTQPVRQVPVQSGKQAASVQLRNSDLMSTIRAVASPLVAGRGPTFDRWKLSSVSDWRLAEPHANPLCCPLTGVRTREMSIQEASPLGQYPTLPACGEGLATSPIDRYPYGQSPPATSAAARR